VIFCTVGDGRCRELVVAEFIRIRSDPPTQFVADDEGRGLPLYPEVEFASDGAVLAEEELHLLSGAPLQPECGFGVGEAEILEQLLLPAFGQGDFRIVPEPLHQAQQAVDRGGVGPVLVGLFHLPDAVLFAEFNLVRAVAQRKGVDLVALD
jgi:hypothetical protein